MGEKIFNTINHKEINNLFEFNSDDTIALFMIYPTNKAIRRPPNGSIIFDVK